MKMMRIFVVLLSGLGVSACATVQSPSSTISAGNPPEAAQTTPAGYKLAPPVGQGKLTLVQAATFDRHLVFGPDNSPVTVNRVTVRVPDTLRVSEANRYLPAGDIVWRGDPIGDRRAQVRTIFEDALARGVEPLNGPIKVDLEVEVKRFHALTEKARYTVGGVHSITFDMLIKNAMTGELLIPVRTIRADLDAFGGEQALQAEAAGQTQKVRISDHLAEVIRQELSNPEGYKNANLGLFQVLNNL